MAYDEDLAARVRALLAGEPDLTEQAMFGGLAFLLGGHMAVAVSGQGGLMVRVAPAAVDRLVATTHAERMQMGGRTMRNWLLLGAEAVRTARQLAPWVRRGTDFVRTLPPKRPKADERAAARR